MDRKKTGMILRIHQAFVKPFDDIRGGIPEDRYYFSA